MQALTIPEETNERLLRLEYDALKVLGEVLRGERPMDDQVKAAQTALGVVAKNRQTMTNRQAIQVAMARTAGTDQEFGNFVRASAPEIWKAMHNNDKPAPQALPEAKKRQLKQG